MPRTTNYPIVFRLQDVFDGLMTTVGNLKPPSFAYLHLWSPHEPFRYSKPFSAQFADGWVPLPKPYHPLNNPALKLTDEHIDQQRLSYDRYVAELDTQFGRLLDFLTSTGILDQSYVVVTSDHGQLFERGVIGHVTRLLYDPVVRVPLLVSAPGQTSRRDVNIPTSGVDVLPTLVHLSGAQVPTWCEGQILPALGGAEDSERSIFMVEAKDNPAFSALTNASFALRKGRYKLIYYIGFRQQGTKGERFELYDIEADPGELRNLYADAAEIAAALRKELLGKIQSENARIRRAR